MSSHPWDQVVSINRWRQDVLSVKKDVQKDVRRQDVAYAWFHACGFYKGNDYYLTMQNSVKGKIALIIAKRY